MKAGTVIWFAYGTGQIAPKDHTQDVFFLRDAYEGEGDPASGLPVKYELYPDGDPVEARRVLPVS